MLNYNTDDKPKEVHAVYEDDVHKSASPPVMLSGPELAVMMKIGTRVVRGVDWKWGDQVTLNNYCTLMCQANLFELIYTCHNFTKNINLSQYAKEINILSQIYNYNRDLDRSCSSYFKEI